MKLYQALALEIADMMRGRVLAAKRGFRNCIRLNYGHPRTAEHAAAIATLGQLIRIELAD